MSARNWKVDAAKMTLLVGGFAAVYFAASGADLWTTALALHRPDASEGNVFATTSGAYNSAKAWWITEAAAVLVIGLFVQGVAYAGRVSPYWLDRPMRSYFYRHFNPLFIDTWSKRSRDRAPIHAVSFALAFVVLRFLAAGNNLIIAAGYAGPLGLAVRAVGRLTTPGTGLLIAMGTLYIALAIGVSPVSALFLRSLRVERNCG